MKTFVFVNQVTGPLFIDILNDFASKENCKVILLTGEVEKASASLDPTIEVQYLIKYNRMKAVYRIYTWLMFTIQTFWKLLFLDKNSELFLVSNPPFVPILSLFFKKFFHQTFHLLIYDIYPDALVNFGYIKKDSFIYKIWAKINKKLFNEAKTVFTISENMSQTILYYAPEAKPVVVHNWVDTSFIKPMDKSENWFVDKHDLKDKFVVMYSGNLGQTHDLESLIEAANLLRDHKEIQFLIIGEGVKKASLMKMIEAYDLKNVLMLPFQAPEVIPFSMTAADIGVVTLGVGAEALSVPSKTYYMLSAGNCILAIALRNSELGNLIEKYDCGAICNPGDVAVISDFILQMKENRSEFDKKCINARNASNDFTMKNAMKFYESVNSK
ncbi:hypothetical protein YH65_07100 [Sulfurovum lithotrophicum]|uniref:Glycosyl transferase family 1 domain-containing protein n=1 Tax=Sulfurovum lithotrophicum TaxID=206403 RepID=A0A7U4M1J8_9BACT|nr:glycosyltransferase family 4 protein [Sulfurovum lithotrophicum]AKF25184.1 hypothetical protein YH65_07100 [Sulfurovum lithotrophicum]